MRDEDGLTSPYHWLQHDTCHLPLPVHVGLSTAQRQGTTRKDRVGTGTVTTCCQRGFPCAAQVVRREPVQRRIRVRRQQILRSRPWRRDKSHGTTLAAIRSRELALTSESAASEDKMSFRTIDLSIFTALVLSACGSSDSNLDHYSTELSESSDHIREVASTHHQRRVST